MTQGIRAVFLQTVIRGQVLRDVDGLTVGPQVLEVVVGAGVGDEDVDDDAGIVQQHPVLGVKTLRGVGLDAALGKLILHLVGQRAHLRGGGTRGDDEVVSEDGQAVHLEHPHVLSLLLVEAVTGRNLLIRANMQEAMLHTVANTLKANNVAALPARAEAVMAENKAMSKELEDIKARVAASKVTSLFDNAETVGDVKIASAYFTGTSGDTLRGMCDTIRDNAKAAAVAVLVGKSDDKITMAVTVTKDAQAKGLKAGNLVKEISAIAGGKGGGKPDFAMAGLKDETKIDEALAAVKSIVEKQLG